ncbi:MAG: uroporphyrinogen decarboxylase family protein [Anaerolineales bacterium]
MTTKRERLEAAFAGEVADRPPVALWRHFPVDDQDPELLAKAAALFQKTYDFDFVKVTPASSYCLKDWGVRDEWRGATEGTREYTQRVIQSPDDWPKLPKLDPQKGFLGNQLRCLEYLKANLSEEVPIIQTIFSPLAQAKNLAGIDRLLADIHRDPTKVEAGLEVITESTVAFVDAVFEMGIDGIFYAVQHASYRYFDVESYDRFGKAYDLRILGRAASGWCNVLHLHGEALIFELAQEYPVQAVNWHDRETWPDLRTGKSHVRGAVCGGVRRESMVYKNASAVAEEAQDALNSTDGRGVVLGTGCVVPIIAPHANILAVRDAANCV